VFCVNNVNVATAQQLKAIEEESARVAAEKIPQRRFGSGVTKQVQQQYIQRQQQARANLSKIQEAKVAEQTAIDKYNQSQKDYDSAASLANVYIRGGTVKGSEFLRLNTESKRLYKQMIKGYGGTYTGGDTVQVEGVGGVSIAPELQDEYATRQAGRGYTVTTDKYIYPGAKTVKYDENVLGSYYQQSIAPSLAIDKLTKEAKASVSPTSKTQLIVRKYPVLKNTYGAIITGYKKADEFLRTKVTNPTAKYLGSKGFTISNIEGAIETRSKQYKLDSRFYAGAVGGIIRDVKDKPAKQLALAGGGSVLGFGLKGAGSTIAAIEKSPIGKSINKKIAELGIGTLNVKKFKRTGTFDATALVKTTPPTIKTLSESGLKYGGIGLTGVAATKITKELITTDIKTAGAILGTNVKDLALVGAGTYGGFRGYDFLNKYYRTLGAERVPMESVIAPETLIKKQKYPLLEKGQTAGELRKEFFEQVLPSEKGKKAPRAFTASPTDFDKFTRIRTDETSEVIGLFGSGRINPTFFKLQKRYKLFGTGNLLDINRPTSIRLTLRSAEYAPGITPKTSKPTGKYQKDFFEDIIGTGRSAIPFAKSEKEIVTAGNTPIARTGKLYYFKYGKDRIPIKQYEILEYKPKLGKYKGKPVIELKDLSSYYGRGSRSSIISPLSYGLSSSIRLGSGNSYASSSLKSLTSSLTSYKPQSRKSRLSSSKPSKTSYNPYSSITSGGGSSYPRSPTSRPPSIKPPKVPPTIFPKFKLKSSFGKGLTKGFRTFFIQKGKKKYLPGLTTRGQALRRGQEFTLKNLRATFGIEQGRKLIKGNGLDFKVRQDLFRGYRIRKGKRIALQDTFIQRRGKRLVTSGEVRELIGSKR
jgi:hypothetical protein